MTLRRFRVIVEKIGSTIGVEVQGFTIEEIMKHFALHTIDFLKVDIEGAEYDLFEKTPLEILKKVNRIGMEYHSNESKEVLFDRIIECGISGWALSKKKGVPESSNSFVNTIALEL